MANIDEQDMRDYLLGKLSPERQAELQALLHGNADLREEAHAAEEELIDQYLAEQLSTDEKERFETCFLTTEERQQRLRFGRVFETYRNNHLSNVVSEEFPAMHRAPAPPTPSVPASSPLFSSFNRNPAFTVLLVVLAGLILTVLGWLMFRDSPANHVVTQSRPASVLKVTLAPESTSSDGGIKHLLAPPQNAHVKLELELSKSNFKKYKTQLFRENQALASEEEAQAELQNAHYVVPVTVTGKILTPGDYQLKLTGVADSGEPAFIDNYPFRVTTK